jgi:PAS domain S-box-containing protein
VTQYRIITPTGNGRFLQTTADPVRDDTGLVVRTFGTTMDITALREAEQALRDSESRHRLLVETMNHGMGALDRDMTFTFVNDKLCEIFGCGRETLIGMRLPALLDAENSAILARQWELRRNHGQDPYELAVLRPDGSRRHTIVAPVPLYDAVGNFLGSFATMTDITERKHMEEELRRSEEKFAKAFRTSLEAWFISDMETACFVDFNDAFVALIGHTRDQLLACDALALGIWAQPEERPRFMALLEAKGQIRNAVIEVRTRGGDIRVVEMSAQMIEIGGRRRFLGMLRDISERLRLERELQRHREHLEAEVVRRTAELTSANEELRAMAHSIFHDLKAPLRAVEGFATWLREDCGAELDTRGLEYLERIAASTQRMGEMIDDLLALARLGERVTLASVDMALVWSRARADLAENIRASGARVSVAGTLPRVHGHQATLEVLLRNLLSNALKFVKPGVPPRVTLAVAPDGPRYRFCVSDNGIGIAPEYRERIFDLFERLHTREEYPGTGVGLALVRKAVQIHGGSLNVESSPGQGSAFWFTLSADPSPTPSLSCPTPHLAPP